MLKVNFFIKPEKAKKNGLCPIFAKLSLGNKSTTITTGKLISKERWNSTSNLKGALRLESEKIVRESLDIFKLNVERKMNELSKFGVDVTLELLKTEFQGKTIPSKKIVGIISIIEKHNSYFRKKANAGDRAAASLQKYERAKTLLASFLSRQYGMDEMDAMEIDSAFVFNLESYLRYDSTFKGTAGIRNNSVVKYMRMYKTAYRYAIRMGIIDRNPFGLYDGKLHVSEAVFLTQHELDLIEDKAFGIQRLERVKNIFLFSCYTGYAPVDATALRESNIMEDGSSALWIMARRAKTNIRSNVPLLPPAISIIEKYRGRQLGLLPSISNQKMNAYLKEIGDICGLEKRLTWYMARHTLATTVAVANVVRIENVSAMMGHTNITQTQHYAKVMDQEVLDDMSRLKDRYR